MTVTAIAAAPAAPRRGRKVLVPLATLIAATGIALASGATFSTSTASTGLVASGTLNQTNSNSVAFTRANLKPGDVVTGTVTITNSGSLPALLSVTEKTPAAGDITFDTQWLKLTVEDVTATPVTVSNTALGSAGAFVQKAPVAAGASKTYRYTVTFDAAAPNSQQNKLASTSYTFATVQTDAETFGDTQRGDVQKVVPVTESAPLANSDAAAPNTVVTTGE